MITTIKHRFATFILIFLLLTTGCRQVFAAKEPVYIKLSYNDLLASKLWNYSNYNNKDLINMIKSDISVYAQIFTPNLYKRYEANAKEYQLHFEEILNAFIEHLNHYYRSNYYLDKTVVLPDYNKQNSSYTINVPKRFFIEYGENLPFSISGHNFLPSYYIDLKGDYKAIFTYSVDNGENIAKNKNQDACLRIFLRPHSLKQIDFHKNYANDNYTAEILSFHLYPNTDCDSQNKTE